MAHSDQGSASGTHCAAACVTIGLFSHKTRSLTSVEVRWSGSPSPTTSSDRSLAHRQGGAASPTMFPASPASATWLASVMVTPPPSVLGWRDGEEQPTPAHTMPPTTNNLGEIIEILGIGRIGVPGDRKPPALLSVGLNLCSRPASRASGRPLELVRDP